MTSTNLALPVSEWTAVASNLLSASGSFTNVIPVNPTAPANFYLIKQ